MVQLQTPAKVNLYLKVFEKRADGFHRMETIMLKVGLYDELRMILENGDGVTLEVENSPHLEVKDNLIVRAAHLFLTTSNLKKRVHFSLKKNIFIAAGLGGGSSDAALTLKMLNEACGSPLSFERLLELGATLGSDVPFFIYDTSIGFAHGRGELIVPWRSLPKRDLVLVNPGFGISTGKVYQKLARPALTWKEEFDTKLAHAKVPESWKEVEALAPFQNDLQSVVEEEFPAIGKIRGQLMESGATFSMMSGSGSTVFGFFENLSTAEQSLENFKSKGFRAVLVSSL